MLRAAWYGGHTKRPAGTFIPPVSMDMVGESIVASVLGSVPDRPVANTESKYQ